MRVTKQRVLDWFSNQYKYTLKTELTNDLKSKTEVLIHCEECGYERYKVLSEIINNRYSCMGCLKIKQRNSALGVPVYSHNEYIEKLHKASPKIKCLSIYTLGSDIGDFECFQCGKIYQGSYTRILHAKKYLCNECVNKRKSDLASKRGVVNFYKKYNDINFQFSIDEIPQSSLEYFKVVCKKCHSSVNLNRRRISRGHMCPVCEASMSSGEREIVNILEYNNISFIKEYFFVNPLLNNRGQRMDFYLSDYNLFIEFQGSQHYDENNAWHSDYLNERDRKKFAYSLLMGWNLCYVYESNDIFEQLECALNLSNVNIEKPLHEYEVDYSVQSVLNYMSKPGVTYKDVCNKFNIGYKTAERYLSINGIRGLKELQIQARWENIPDEDFLDYLSHNGLRRTASYYDKTVKTVTTHMNNLGYKKLYELQLERKTIIDAFDKKYILDLIVSEKGLLGASKKLGFPKYVLEHYLPSLGYKNYQEVVKFYIKES